MTMRVPWSSRLGILAAVAVAQACLAAHAEAAGIAERATLALSDLNIWISQGYARAPALMLGLSILLAVPLLVLAGLLLRRKRRRRSSNATVMLPRKRAPEKTQSRTLHTEISPWPTEAWVEADGFPGSRREVGRTLLRIGREADNDICFAVKTVHRYHAVIRRTTDGVVMITDLSGKDGNGVLVNGARVAEARLSRGDVINIGEVKMRFDARPV
jgi:hypothetical protein